MTDWNERIDDLIASLKQQRDELRVQMHLGKAEAKQEFDRLGKKLDELVAEAEAQSKPLREAAGESARDIGSALELVGEEIQKGYARIRDLLKS